MLCAPSPGLRSARFVHSFSHYHLRVTPLLMTGIGTSRVAEDGERGWFSREELPTLGLPAPVRRLLETVFDEERSEFEEQRWQEPSIA